MLVSGRCIMCVGEALCYPTPPEAKLLPIRTLHEQELRK